MNTKYDEVKKFAEKWVDGIVKDYANCTFEAVSNVDGMDTITFGNLDEFKELGWKDINHINNTCDSFYESLYEDIEKEFSWDEGELEQFWDEYEMDICPEIGSYALHEYDEDGNGFFGVQMRIWEQFSDWAEDDARENEIANGKKFSKDDVVKFFKKAVEEFDEELDWKKKMWFRTDFNGDYEEGDISSVANCDIRMLKIGRLEIDEDDDILIDLVSIDKISDLNVDATVIEMIDKVAA